MFNSIAVSNRFVAEGIAGHAATQLAARALAEAASNDDTPIAFTSRVALGAAQCLEAVVPGEHALADAPGFRASGEPGWIQHVSTGVLVQLHVAGTPILGGPVEWPDPRDTDSFMGIPVLRLNAFLETEITRALNAADGSEHEANAMAAIVAGGAAQDRTHELHAYVADRYQDLWEKARSRQLWSAVA